MNVMWVSMDDREDTGSYILDNFSDQRPLKTNIVGRLPTSALHKCGHAKQTPWNNRIMSCVWHSMKIR